MNRTGRKEPLYRKVNTRTRGVHHRTGGDFRHQRNSKREKHDFANEISRATMHGREQRGLDYTPLFRFLLSKVGEPWASIHAEAVTRLDREEPIYWLVARNYAERNDHVCIGGNAFYNGLYIDESARLAKVAPGLRNEDLEPTCPCCTHTFNGMPFVRKFKPTAGCE